MNNQNYFDQEVKEATRWYNRINNFFWVLSLIESYIVAGIFSSSSTGNDVVLFMSISLALSLVYTLLYVVIRVIIKSYGEKVRSNLLNQIMLEKLYDISLK